MAASMAAAKDASSTLRSIPVEAWLLMGSIDGRVASPAPLDDVGGVPHVLRLACEAAMAGARRIVVVWSGANPLDVSALANDSRLHGAVLSVTTTTPVGDAHDPILVVRGDRVFHRDMPKQAVAAWRRSSAAIAKVAGAEHDAVWVAERELAARFIAVANEPRGLTRELERHAADTALADPPYLAFTTHAADRAALRRAERRLVWSLRKSADGVAAKLINRRLSLPITWLLRRTSVLPNHVTAVALLCAITGGIVLGRGGYMAAAIGMLLVEAGSIIDGIDGELARLKFLFSRTGQWFDTVADDLANIAYWTGAMVNLSKAGVGWAFPLWAVAITCFLLTQSTQYFLIRVVYKSGDLAAIPWAFQSSEFLSQRPKGLWRTITATAPKLLKRDFAVTLFTALAMVGRLDMVLLIACAGAIAFFGVFFTQLARNWSALPRR